jgi:hypothetical protein
VMVFSAGMWGLGGGFDWGGRSVSAGGGCCGFARCRG